MRENAVRLWCEDYAAQRSVQRLSCFVTALQQARNDARNTGRMVTHCQVGNVMIVHDIKVDDVSTSGKHVVDLQRQGANSNQLSAKDCPLDRSLLSTQALSNPSTSVLLQLRSIYFPTCTAVPHIRNALRWRPPSTPMPHRGFCASIANTDTRHILEVRSE